MTRFRLAVLEGLMDQCRRAARALGTLWLAGVVLAGAALVALPAAAQVEVSVPSLDRPGPSGEPVLMPGWWFGSVSAGAASGATSGSAPATAAAKAPALVLLHGCGGLRDAQGGLGPRYKRLAAWLRARGVQALVVDSLTPRGEKELCTQRIGQRRVTQVHRQRDALGALQWLSTQPGVDAARLGLLGWSHGGSAVLASTNQRRAPVRAAPVQASLAVAFYPGCEADLQHGYETRAPLLMLLGEADDWTAAAPCKALAAAATGVPPVYEAYEGAYHGFDGLGPVVHLPKVPNGVHPGQGVHMGGQAAAREASHLRLEQFLRQQWGINP